MPVEQWVSDNKTKHGWACIEPGCFDCGPGFETKDEAADDLDRHMNEKHYGSAS